MAKPGLTLHRLRLFLAVLDQGGVARAAAKEHISQPAVSEHLRGLEEHFGVRLFERVGRGVCATAAARQLEPYVRQVVQLLKTAEQLASDLQGVRTGSLTVGASTTPGTYLLPHALGRFRVDHPGIALQLRIRNSAQVEAWVASGEVELGVIGDVSNQSDLFSSDPWLKDELVVLLNKQHPMSRRASASLSAFASEPIITREPGSNTRLTTERAFRKLGITLNPVMELGSTEAIREAVAAGLGLAFVSRYESAQHDPRVAVIRLDGVGSARRFTIIRRADTSLGPAATRFMKVLFDELPGGTAAPSSARRAASSRV
jgi:DNA-binding transcriptional LysR family regulator